MAAFLFPNWNSIQQDSRIWNGISQIWKAPFEIRSHEQRGGLQVIKNHCTTWWDLNWVKLWQLMCLLKRNFYRRVCTESSANLTANKHPPVLLASFMRPSISSSLNSIPRFLSINCSSWLLIMPSWSLSRRSNAVRKSARRIKGVKIKKDLQWHVA